jgi:hypothetical protein
MKLRSLISGKSNIHQHIDRQNRCSFREVMSDRYEVPVYCRHQHLHCLGCDRDRCHCL